MTALHSAARFSVFIANWKCSFNHASVFFWLLALQKKKNNSCTYRNVRWCQEANLWSTEAAWKINVHSDWEISTLRHIRLIQRWTRYWCFIRLMSFYFQIFLLNVLLGFALPSWKCSVKFEFMVNLPWLGEFSLLSCLYLIISVAF